MDVDEIFYPFRAVTVRQSTATTPGREHLKETLPRSLDHCLHLYQQLRVDPPAAEG